MRDRDFTIRVETIGDVMRDVHEQLRLRGILPTLPLLSTAILWLMLDLLDEEVLAIEHRMVCEVSHGYLHLQTGRTCTSDKLRLGHISRAVKALVEVGVVKVLMKGNGMILSKYEICIPKTVGTIDRRIMSGRSPGCAGGGGKSAQARIPTKAITRAGGGGYSAQAEQGGFRQRAISMRAGETGGGHTLSCSAAAAAAALRGQQQSPEDCARGTSENLRQAIELLTEQGIPPFDAADILNDPKIRIADDKLCEVIRRIAADRPGKKNNPGGWWRVALQKHHGYGDDPVAESIQAAKSRPPSKPLDQTHYQAEGFKLVDAMDEDELMEAHAVLIGYYESTNNSEALAIFNRMDEPRHSREFWQAVGKNKSLIVGEGDR